jgi:hypothetical protein
MAQRNGFVQYGVKPFACFVDGVYYSKWMGCLSR